ncbi:hypothetical protein Aduo_007132 [Ancylostoma duodenale]
MVLIGIVLAYWYYLEKARKEKEQQNQACESKCKYDLPVEKVAAYPLDQRTYLKPSSKKKESTQETQEDIGHKFAGADKMSSVVSKGTSKSKISNESSKKNSSAKTKGSGIGTAECIDEIAPQVASKYTFLKNKKSEQESSNPAPFSEPISEQDLDLYESSGSPTKTVVSQQRKLNAALSSLFNTNTIRSQSISDARSGIWSLDDRKEDKPKAEDRPKSEDKSKSKSRSKSSKKSPFAARFSKSKSGKRKKFAMQSDDLITPSCTVKFTSVTPFQIN